LSGAGEDRAALDHVLVLAPYRRDAEYLRQLLIEHDLEVRICSTGTAIAPCLAASPGVLVATHEALTPDVVTAVGEWLETQPGWSEMPVIVLLDRSSNPARVKTMLGEHWPRARQIFYQRPVAPVELISGIQAAFLARLRQRDVRDHIDREIELRRELNHRVKNILASVTSIFEMTQRRADTLDGFSEDFRGRLGALSNVHSAVFNSDGEAVSIQEIVDLTFEPYRLPGDGRVVAEGPQVMLSREAGTSLALCLHELATNAIKYGALSRDTGQVRFTWGLSADEVWARWQENGGPPVVEPSRVGYGTRYLRSALSSLFGAPPVLTFDPAGLICEAQGRLSRVTRNS
jgi:two-component sensor histidine kinase